MPTNETPATDNTETTTDTPETTDTGDTTRTTQTTAETAPAAGSVAELPEWAQQELTRARTEAAKYRRERNAAQKALQDKDTDVSDQESRADLDRLTGELAAAQLDNARLRAALAADVPPAQAADFAARLVGDTDDELAADAQRLRELLGLPTPPDQSERPDRKRPDPSQGAGLDHGAGSEDTPAEAFAAFIQDRLK